MMAAPPGGQALRSFLFRSKVATLDELKAELGTKATMTVFRRLREVGYRTSYSHRGRYYTLEEVPEYDAWGLWTYESVRFSQYGNLLQTSQALVEQASAGLTAEELYQVVQVDVKQPLLQLVRRGQLHREKIGSHYVYLTLERDQRRRQKLGRAKVQAQREMGAAALDEGQVQELQAGIILFYSLLDEKQRRLYAGLESFKLGHGGDRSIAVFLGLDEHTVARGRRELFSGDVERARVRKRGAGRPAVEKKRRR